MPVARLLLLVRVAPPYAPVAQATRPAGRCSDQEDARGRGCLGPGCLPGWPRRGRRRLDEVAGTWWPAVVHRDGRRAVTARWARPNWLSRPWPVHCAAHVNMGR